MARYEQEVRAHAAQFDPDRPHPEPGKALLREQRWAWIVGDDDEAGRWRRYAREYRGLKAMNPDGTWREWVPRGAG